jgi:hypothetical protein
MNRQQFFQWMDDPASLNTESQAELEELIRNYPFFQTARLLNLLNLKLLGDYRFEHELRKVAALSADRARLREWLIKLEVTGEEGIKQAKKDIPGHTTAIDQEKDIHLRYLEEQIKESLQEIELKKSRLNELLEEKKAIAGSSELLPEEPGRQQKGPVFRPLPKDDLLEEFIRDSKNRAAERANFFNPEDTALKSIEDNDEILSETLARLVAAQGKKDKAMKIYQKLMLKYPQKSSYFAAQIEKLRKES